MSFFMDLVLSPYTITKYTIKGAVAAHRTIKKIKSSDGYAHLKSSLSATASALGEGVNTALAITSNCLDAFGKNVDDLNKSLLYSNLKRFLEMDPEVYVTVCKYKKRHSETPPSIKAINHGGDHKEVDYYEQFKMKKVMVTLLIYNIDHYGKWPTYEFIRQLLDYETE